MIITAFSLHVNRRHHSREGHIITLEDPLEYLHRHDKCIVSQREICTDTESYLVSLRATLRQSPDVILLGEMRDYETIQTAMTAAETGHLVLSSLHTTGAANTIGRIVDVFEPAETDFHPAVHGTAGCYFPAACPGCEWTYDSCLRGYAPQSGDQNMIRDNKVHQIDGVIASSAHEHMRSMDQSLLELYKQKKITKETALKFASNADMLKRKLL